MRVLSASEKVEDTPEGGLQEGMLELLSEYYVKDLARKVRRGMEGNALKARDNGYRIFGYSTDPETRCYVINEAEANAVREMFSMHISGNSVNSIAREMASRGWTTTTGKPVDYNWAWRVLNRKAYTGLYSWGGIEVPGGMPQIIDEVTFARSQAVVPRKRRKDENWDVYRLTGKLYCGLCGKPMHGTAGTGKKGKRYHYYACRESDGCRRPWVRRELLEDSIADAVLETCSDERRMRMLASQMCEITEDDIVGYMMHGFNRDDEDFIFGSIVREAYLFDDCVLLVFNFRDEVGDLTEIRVALQAQKKCEPGGGFALCSRGVGGGI